MRLLRRQYDGGRRHEPHGSETLLLRLPQQAQRRLSQIEREQKNLEYTVAKAVYDFLSRRENAELAAQDTIRHYEQRTGEDSLRSIEARIRHAQDEAEQLTNAFIFARNVLLRANIEKKMTEQEILIKDLCASKAQIELERGKKITKEKIIDFIAEMLKGDPSDKGYQKKLIDILVYKVFVYDDNIITYLTFGNDKEIKEISLADTDKAIADKGVQPLSSLVRRTGLEPVRLPTRPSNVRVCQFRHHRISLFNSGAEGRTRTDTPSRAPDFESGASAISPLRRT